VSTPRTSPGGPPWAGPQWEDPLLTRLAHRLREAHRMIAPLPPEPRRRLIRHLLTITDLAKRDCELADRRLQAFLADFRERVGAQGDQADTSSSLISSETP